ncbi:MAG TPA: Rrf2 family transcriptional regulator [Bacteroidia bacterium]|nr:Rrf2 family transcriptional regulator [Bacteroidia bacterium]
MLPKKSKYAIKALVFLAKKYRKNKPVRINEISEAEKIPRKFLEAILLELRKNGLLGSKMGAGGGYYLLKHPEEIMLSNVIRITGGPIALLPCVSLNFYEPCVECLHEVTCGLRDVVLQVREASIKILSKTSIEDIILREKKLEKKIQNPVIIKGKAK